MSQIEIRRTGTNIICLETKINLHRIKILFVPHREEQCASNKRSNFRML